MIDIDSIVLSKGSHDCDDPQGCLFEFFNLLAGLQRKTDDCPPGVSHVLHRFGIRLNDALSDGKRQQLKQYLPGLDGKSVLDGTADDGLDEKRRLMAVDWAVRVGTPMWLDAAGFTDFATELRALAPIDSYEARVSIRSRLWEIRDACWDARREALKKIRESKGDSAAAVAEAAAAAVAAAAAEAAAEAEAEAAAEPIWGKAWQEIYDRVYAEVKVRVLAQLAPVTDKVHDSAIALYHNMVRPT